MQLFTFEPGDGTSYQVLFGRLPSRSPFVPHYMLFGFAEAGDALITCVFDTEQIAFDVFWKRWCTAEFTSALSGTEYLTNAAWALLAALIGAALPARDVPTAWRADWRQQIPPALLS